MKKKHEKTFIKNYIIKIKPLYTVAYNKQKVYKTSY